MSTFTESFSAGETKTFTVSGRFLLLVNANSGLNIRFFRDRVALAETVQSVTAGFSFEIDKGFDAFEIYSAAAQSVQILTSEGKVGFSSSVTITGAATSQAKNGTPTQAAATVTNISAQLVAANANRRYLLVQNKSASGSVYLNFAAATATTANGLKLGPGEAYESSAGWVSSAQINAIGDIGSNPDVIVIEGA